MESINSMTRYLSKELIDIQRCARILIIMWSTEKITGHHLVSMKYTMMVIKCIYFVSLLKVNHKCVFTCIRCTWYNKWKGDSKQVIIMANIDICLLQKMHVSLHIIYSQSLQTHWYYLWFIGKEPSLEPGNELPTAKWQLWLVRLGTPAIETTLSTFPT